VDESQNRTFHFSFNASFKVDFQSARVTYDSSLLLVHELDERLGFGKVIEEHLQTPGAGRIISSPSPPY
jgi:hypothetical protein